MGDGPTITKKEKLYANMPIFGAAFIVLAGWVIYIFSAAFGIDLATQRREGGTPAVVYLWVAVGLTVVGGLVALYYWRRNERLFKHGVMVEARVVNSGMFGTKSKVGYQGSLPVAFVYTYEGKEYRQRKDVPVVIAAEYTAETRIPVRIDPKNPKVCIIQA